jgi:hypothetical protein
VQALLVSDATRSGAAARSSDVGPFLADMAMRSLDALNKPVGAEGSGV